VRASIFSARRTEARSRTQYDLMSSGSGSSDRTENATRRGVGRQDLSVRLPNVWLLTRLFGFRTVTCMAQEADQPPTDPGDDLAGAVRAMNRKRRAAMNSLLILRDLGRAKEALRQYEAEVVRTAITVEGHSWRNVADALGESVGTVHGRHKNDTKVTEQ
jgi:hypothetical protein